jgi:hypothetical protein
VNSKPIGDASYGKKVSRHVEIIFEALASAHSWSFRFAFITSASRLEATEAEESHRAAAE